MSEAFDAAAATYDREFSQSALTQDLRRRVWEVWDRHLPNPGRVLDLGCGTGEDALHLARSGHRVTAIDVSNGMLAEARRKLRDAALLDRVELQRLDLSDLREIDTESAFDLVVSNFGVLNCLGSLEELGTVLATVLRPHSHAALVLMGRFCPAEVTSLLLRAQPRQALRRWRRPGSQASVGGGSRISVWYPTPRQVLGELGPRFRLVDAIGLGTLLPPPDLTPPMEPTSAFFRVLTRLDRRLGQWPLAAWFSDHYLLDLERLP